MTGISEAVSALKRAEDEARAIVAAARLQLGREILKAREAGVPQKDIAGFLELTREQVRRLSKAAKDAASASAES